jgi:hypothetical protein
MLRKLLCKIESKVPVCGRICRLAGRFYWIMNQGFNAIKSKVLLKLLPTICPDYIQVPYVL